jgi:redox-sensitive bicupin YhaK (pirin superfamily)
MDGPEIAPCTVELRPSTGLGRTQSGGLCGTHHFCFATYQRPDRLEWGALRALNEYRLAPGAIRSPTFHSGFDIVTLVTGGSLRRLGTYAPRQLLEPGSAELVSAGRGVDLGMETVGTEAATYLEIWIRTGPGRREPRREWLGNVRRGLVRPLATSSPFQPGTLKLRGRASISSAALPAKQQVIVATDRDECAYLSVRAGSLTGDGIRATAGDAVAIGGSAQLILEAEAASELLLVRTANAIRVTACT